MSDVPGLVVGTTTLPDRAAAEALAETLVREGLAACAQVDAEIVSFYVWQGKLERDGEVRVTLKVTAARWRDCVARLRELHPAELPQITAWRAELSAADYARWAAETAP
jgi:periplasmic divalent cation tolerance protein